VLAVPEFLCDTAVVFMYKIYTQTNGLLQLLCTYPSTVNHVLTNLTTVLLHTGEDTKVKRLFYVIVYSLMVGQLGPKHVGVDVLKHKCDCNELCLSVGSHCYNTRDILYMYNILVARKCSLHRVQREFGAHPASYLVGNVALSLDIK
jgi:hypothetical protein